MQSRVVSSISFYIMGEKNTVRCWEMLLSEYQGNDIDSGAVADLGGAVGGNCPPS